MRIRNRTAACVVMLTVLAVIGLTMSVTSGQVDTSGVKAAAVKAPDRPPVKPVIDPQAKKLLRQMGEYLSAAKSLSFHAEVTYDDVLPSGQKLQYSASMDMASRRSDGLQAEIRGDLGGKRVWYDGKSVTLHDGGQNVYSVTPGRPTLEATLDAVMRRHGMSVPLADFVRSDVYESLTGDVKFGVYVGLHNVGGQRCHHLAFVQKLIEWQIWIEDGKQLVPRKIVITYKTLPGSPQYAAVLSDWDLTTPIPDRMFTADLPDTAELIEFLEVKPLAPKANP
jgi:hypothetical protein